MYPSCLYLSTGDDLSVSDFCLLISGLRIF